MFFLSAGFFSKLTKSFMNTIRVSNSLDPDQDRHCVGPDVCPSCLQSYQQTTKVPLARKELMRLYSIFLFQFLHIKESSSVLLQ